MGKYTGKTCRLLIMLFLTTMFFFIELVVGYVTNSMAMVADSFHMLSDILALLIGFFSVRISRRKTSKNTFGWIRAEVLGALVNGVFLVALCFSILIESIKRLILIEEIHNPRLLLIVGSFGLLINIIGLFLFHHHAHGHNHSHAEHVHHEISGSKYIDIVSEPSSEEINSEEYEVLPSAECSNDKESHYQVCNDDVSKNDLKHRKHFPNNNHDDKTSSKSASPNPAKSGEHSEVYLNMRGVFLHVLGDALGSIIVIVSALFILYTKFEWRFYLDPAMSVILVIIILSTTLPLLRESALILLQTVPTHIRVIDLEDRLIRSVQGVLAVHEFHVWQLAGNRIIATAHIRCHNPAEYMVVAEKVKEFFHREGIHSTTIQPEFEEEPMEDEPCVLRCKPKNNMDCITKTCCGKKNGDILASVEVEAAAPTNKSRSSDVTMQERSNATALSVLREKTSKKNLGGKEGSDAVALKSETASDRQNPDLHLEIQDCKEGVRQSSSTSCIT